MMNREDYTLVCLIKECARIQEECSKALSFGLDYKGEEGQSAFQKVREATERFIHTYHLFEKHPHPVPLVDWTSHKKFLAEFSNIAKKAEAKGRIKGVEWPVFFNVSNETWGFWEETWADFHDGFTTEKEAIEEFKKYCEANEL